MSLTTRGHNVLALAASVTIIGAAALTGPNRHPATKPAPAHHTASSSTPSSSAAVTLAYPTVIQIPDQLAQAIGQARTNTASTCPSGKATGWAEVEENGHTAIYAACVAGP